MKDVSSKETVILKFVKFSCFNSNEPRSYPKVRKLINNIQFIIIHALCFLSTPLASSPPGPPKLNPPKPGPLKNA